MMAFTVSDDHGRQEELWRSLPDWARSAGNIRDALTGEAVALAKPLAKFVGVEGYVAAGGVIQRDLFDEENEGYMMDRALVLRLAHDKLEASVAGIKAEGWKWVTAELERDYSLHYGRVHPQREEADDGECVYSYAAEEMARAGAVLRVGHDGELAIERGLVRPEDREGKATTEKPAKDPGSLPACLVKELSAHRTAAIQATLVYDADVALAAVVYSLALPLFGGHSSDTCLSIYLKPLKTAGMVTVQEECEGHATMAAEAAMWGVRLPGRPDELFEWCLEQPQDMLLSLLAFCAASSVNAVKDKFDADTSPRLAHADTLGASLSLDMAAQWKPTVEGFYGRVSKATMVHMVQQAGAPLAIRLVDVKKEQAARCVMEAIAETTWLPDALRGKNPLRSHEGDGLAQAA